ncbi:NAD-dependent epimerase/dehydratase family protein [Streptomyces yaizuensis]|uniref:NAD-dependent epimerase/dehydratase family protein n=1 Tax=Streptomyces yaizuensis TaxID=2989713 RepID=A0ABQ5PAF1_9ACTN|nr:NAD-dependent epimerase/dehydratase family protein [Streptomyces sp. YSPA8]GLF99568.1 NAD-dependent epimerase/dehydratase family protein [Streptomyces sp. YSPA8]
MSTLASVLHAPGSQSPPSAPRILVTGAGGFIGGRVAAAARAVPGARVVLMSRRPLPAADPDPAPGDRDGPGDPAVRQVRADLQDPASLRGICDGVDIVLHCAVRIGGPDQAVRAVNEHGARALVAEAERSGVARLVQVSTASVYGRGVFRNAEPAGLPVAPGSETSRSRAAAEQIVLAAGGTVLRPHVVLGAGDRWAVPGLVRIHRRLAATVDGWRTRMSVVDVDDLARAVTAVATAPQDTSGVWHPNHPAPVSCADLFTTLTRRLGLPPATEDIGVEEARRRLAGDSVSLHHLAMLTTDHWFASARLWEETGCPPGRGFADSLARHAPWYRRHLGLSDPPG